MSVAGFVVQSNPIWFDFNAPFGLVTVRRPPGTGSFFGRFDRCATWTRQGRKMCLSPCGPEGQSHFRSGKAYSQGPRRLRRENRDENLVEPLRGSRVREPSPRVRCATLGCGMEPLRGTPHIRLHCGEGTKTVNYLRRKLCFSMTPGERYAESSVPPG